MSVKRSFPSVQIESLAPEPQYVANEMPAALGRASVLAGTDDTLALLQTAVLFARNFRATLRLVVPGATRESRCPGGTDPSSMHEQPPPARECQAGIALEIHFGPASCPALLLGLLDLVRQQLNGLDSRANAFFLVEIGILSDGCFISIHIHPADGPIATPTLREARARNGL